MYIVKAVYIFFHAIEEQLILKGSDAGYNQNWPCCAGMKITFIQDICSGKSEEINRIYKFVNIQLSVGIIQQVLGMAHDFLFYGVSYFSLVHQWTAWISAAMRCVIHTEPFHKRRKALFIIIVIQEFFPSSRWIRYSLSESSNQVLKNGYTFSAIGTLLMPLFVLLSITSKYLSSRCTTSFLSDRSSLTRAPQCCRRCTRSRMVHSEQRIFACSQRWKRQCTLWCTRMVGCSGAQERVGQKPQIQRACYGKRV